MEPNLQRADECQQVSDGYAQLAWACVVMHLPVRAANKCAMYSRAWQFNTDCHRHPWMKIAIGMGFAMVAPWWLMQGKLGKAVG